MIVFGGVTAQGPAPASQDRPNDGAVYSPATGQWQRIPAFPTPNVPGAEALTTLAIWTGTALLVMAQYKGRLHAGTLETWDGPLVIASWTPGAASWHVLQRRGPPGIDPQRRRASTVSSTLLWGAGHVWTGTRVVFVHGNECYRGTSCGGGPPDLAGPNAFTVATASWSKMPETTIYSLGRAATWSGHAIVTIGSTGTAQAYDPTAARWERLPAAPFEAFGAVWTGRSVLAWTSTSTRHHVEVEELVPAPPKGS